MKQLSAFFCLVFFVSFSGFSQQNSQNDILVHVTSIDSIIETFYDVISEEKDVERNWKLFEFLFAKDAKLIPSAKNKDSLHVLRYMTPETYKKSSGSWMLKNGFIVKEIHRNTEVFGSMAHVFSTFEAFYTDEADTQPFLRGIYSIQLLNDGERWWIVNIYWTHEREGQPIPADYLPKEDRCFLKTGQN